MRFLLSERHCNLCCLISSASESLSSVMYSTLICFHKSWCFFFNLYMYFALLSYSCYKIEHVKTVSIYAFTCSHYTHLFSKCPVSRIVPCLFCFFYSMWFAVIYQPPSALIVTIHSP